MFVRTEWNDTVEIYNDDEVSVKPKGNVQWLLFVVDDDDEDNEDNDDDDVEINIGMFESVDEANKALISLREAIGTDLGWDFNQYVKASREQVETDE